MTKQEYEHIRNLAWKLLIDANITKLPTSITQIAKLYNLQNKMDYNRSRFENCKIISHEILLLFGLPSSDSAIKMLAVRLMAPLIILKECKIFSAEQLSNLTQIPYYLCQQRLKRLDTKIQQKTFEISNMETNLKAQFQQFIDEYLNNFPK